MASLVHLLSHPRTFAKLVNLLPIKTILALRLVSRGVDKLLCPDRLRYPDRVRYPDYFNILFSDLRLQLTTNSLTSASLHALPVIGPYCTRLTISIVHSASTQIHRGLRDGNDPDLRHTVFPLPADGYFDSNGQYHLLSPNEQLLPVPPGSLLQLSLALDKWKYLFHSVHHLQELRLRTSGVPAKGLERNVADEMLITIRKVLEESNVAPVLHTLDYIGYAAGAWILAPSIGWEGSAVHNGWWMNITNLLLTLDCEGLELLEPWQVMTIQRGLAELLRNFSGTIRELVLELVPAGRKLLMCPLDNDRVFFPELVSLTLRGWDIGWENDERGCALHDVLSSQATKVLKLVLQHVTLVEGRYGWDRLYLDWELEGRLDNEDSELILNRKEKMGVLRI